MTVLARIVAPHFVAGLVMDKQGNVIEAAPILRYMLGWPRSRVRAYLARKGWEGRIVRTRTSAPPARRP